jgi:carboxypeptidase C (cathepsin A)
MQYTSPNSLYVAYAFQGTGDLSFPTFLQDLEFLLEQGDVRVNLVYGDADYVCNWFGGEAISLAANYSGAEQFRNAGYTNL